MKTGLLGNQNRFATSTQGGRICSRAKTFAIKLYIRVSFYFISQIPRRIVLLTGIDIKPIRVIRVNGICQVRFAWNRQVSRLLGLFGTYTEKSLWTNSLLRCVTFEYVTGHFLNNVPWYNVLFCNKSKTIPIKKPTTRFVYTFRYWIN